MFDSRWNRERLYHAARRPGLELRGRWTRRRAPHDSIQPGARPSTSAQLRPPFGCSAHHPSSTIHHPRPSEDRTNARRQPLELWREPNTTTAIRPLYKPRVTADGHAAVLRSTLDTSGPLRLSSPFAARRAEDLPSQDPTGSSRRIGAAAGPAVGLAHPRLGEHTINIGPMIGSNSLLLGDPIGRPGTLARSSNDAPRQRPRNHDSGTLVDAVRGRRRAPDASRYTTAVAEAPGWDFILLGPPAIPQRTRPRRRSPGIPRQPRTAAY
ncbi:hypothetical protein RhiLY_06844 [Ceratobasidium sp. AG-Ba]|nr:hypothetical protein RhiLY_06844 [Ceratobasidium sp. AG-Ba]